MKANQMDNRRKNIQKTCAASVEKLFGGYDVAEG